jgi:hypothetical protein
MIIGKGHLERHIGWFIDPVGDLEKNVFMDILVSEHVELLDNLFYVPLILPFIEPASMKVGLYLLDIVQRKYRIFSEVLSKLNILHRKP